MVNSEHDCEHAERNIGRSYLCSSMDECEYKIVDEFSTYNYCNLDFQMGLKGVRKADKKRGQDD